MVTVEYRCADGTPFPVEFASEEDAALTWALEREHSKDPATPLAVAFSRLGEPGRVRAYEDAGLRMPSAFRDGPTPFGFNYFGQEPMSPEDMAAAVEGSRRLMEKYGSGDAIWAEYCLPRTKAGCEFLQTADVSTPVARLAEENAYAFHQTMVAMFVTGNDLQLLAKTCNEALGEETPLVAFELTQGYDNETVRADQALWELGRLAMGSPRLADALSAADTPAAMAALRASGDEPGFFAAVDVFLDRYGWRAEDWMLSSPTWREQRGGFWAQIRQMASLDAEAPAATVAKAAARREAVAADIGQRLAQDEAKRAQFRRRLARAAAYVAIREERALWQLITTGSTRHALLRRGEHLVAAGRLTDAEEVFYVLPEEIEGNGDLGTIAAERRAEYERWKGVLPPLVIGGETPTSVVPAAVPEDGLLRGRPGSRGLATGKARVITDLAHADDFEPGEVLVCVMTAPPWTPLFTVASAVVTDTGDIGSHPAIAAREYGIPCVVGTKVATSVITDGTLLTVDGDAGTVEVGAVA